MIRRQTRAAALFSALLLVAACGERNHAAAPATSGGEWHEFQGSWTAAGSRRTLHFDDNRRVAIFDLSGSLVLSGSQRPAVGFRAHAIGFSDTRSGMVGRCVWTDERGEQLFSELKGEFVGSGNRIVGTFIGGTGRYAGTTGEYTFQWQYVIDAEDGAVSGRAIGLEGRARIGSSLADPSGAKGQ